MGRSQIVGQSQIVGRFPDRGPIWYPSPRSWADVQFTVLGSNAILVQYIIANMTLIKASFTYQPASARPEGSRKRKSVIDINIGVWNVTSLTEDVVYFGAINFNVDNTFCCFCHNMYLFCFITVSFRYFKRLFLSFNNFWQTLVTGKRLNGHLPTI